MTRLIALLGAEATGKSSLASALASSAPAPCVVVTEYLREWCNQHNRLPKLHDQAHIAQTQSHRIESAVAQAPAWVLADTTALQTAAYSAQYFNDTAGVAEAVRWHRAHVHTTLLMGTDLPHPGTADWMRDGASAQMDTDARLRHLLTEHGLPFVTVYGRGEARTLAARQALGWHTQAPEAWTRGRWQGVCESCSDPECEHRLFGQLLAQTNQR